ncbi:MAG: HD domain-containing protein [Lachnospiraceae bacterium]|nr:HD domain-containing protein [Lachnospiraceae bacterium]
MVKMGDIVAAMIEYYSNDVRRVNHFLKVYSFAKSIGEREQITTECQEILEIAAITHDIGIREGERLYQSSSGEYQQKLGPKEARKLLQPFEISESVIERVCYLIAHHHTYHLIEGMDYQILIEADFLVNAFEDELDKQAIHSFRDRIFKTGTGKAFLEQLYG